MNNIRNIRQINKYLSSKLINKRYSIDVKAINIDDMVMGASLDNKPDTLKFQLRDRVDDFFTTHIVAVSALASCGDIRGFLDSVVDFLLNKMKLAEGHRYNAIQRVANKLKYEVYSQKN